MERSSPSSSSYENRGRPLEGQRTYLLYPVSRIAQGPLLPPQNSVNMGNTNASSRAHSAQPTQRSNLTALLEGEHHEDPSHVVQEARTSDVASSSHVPTERLVNEADSASGPCPVSKAARVKVHSAPASTFAGGTSLTPPSFLSGYARTQSMEYTGRRSSSNDMASVSAATQDTAVATERSREGQRSVRRCVVNYSFN